MAESGVTVRDVFDLPQPGSPGEASVRWQSLRQWMSEDLAAIKAPALDDLGPTIEQLLNIPISDIFLASWKETDAIKELLAESRNAPDAITNVELADHTIKSKHQPHIEVRQKKATAKKIQFTLRLVFKLQGFSLKIQNGLISEMRTGPCEMQGAFEYQGLAVAEKKNAPIKLPEVVVFHDSPKVETAPVVLDVQRAEASKTPPVADQVLMPPTVERPLTPQPMARAATAAAIEPQKTPDFSSLVPPTKITAKVADGPPLPAVNEPAAETTENEEEDREVFVL